MKVSLVRMTENPIEAIEAAASNCYDSTAAPRGKIMRSCYESGHHSVLEFAQFHFHIEGVSRSLLAQLTRHRTFGFAVRSQRYVSEEDFNFVTPKSILNDQFAYTLYVKTHDKMKQAYQKLMESGVPTEDARYVLPNSCETVVDVICDLRNLIHFCNERLCSRAQWEIRELAQKMRDIVVEHEPDIGEFLVPKCEMHFDHPFCTEKQTCGKHPRLETIYKKPKYKVYSKKKLKNTYLILGRSGSGKDAIVDELCRRHGCTKVMSLTTRPRRMDEKRTHIFVSEKDFRKVAQSGQCCAYTKFNGYEYCATIDQVFDNDFYIIDPNGLSDLYSRLDQLGTAAPRKLIAIGISVDVETAIQRMLQRGSTKDEIFDRITNDFNAFAGFEKRVDKVVNNDDFDACVDEIWTYIQECEKVCNGYHDGELESSCVSCPQCECDDGGFRCVVNGQIG